MSDKLNNIFNSKTAAIPRLRPDIDVIPVKDDGSSYLYFHDMRGYAPPDFALDESVGTILSLLDGRKSINDLKCYLGAGTGTNQLLQYIRFLDENCLLYSPYYKAFAKQVEQQYEQSTMHQSVTAGSSYPAEPNKLRDFLDEAFAKYGDENPEPVNKPVKALYAPHIDPRVGMESYVRAFQKIRHITPQRVVILATSHYAGLYPGTYENKPFIVSRKNFEMPMGTISADREAIYHLINDDGYDSLSSQDRAHRIEHSIELHLLFLSYLWQHEFLIVPILVGGFDDLLYAKKSYLGHQIDHFATSLKNQFGGDDETFFLISGDLAHTGKKFGDDLPATSIKKAVQKFDEQFLQSGEKGSPPEMLQLMKRNYDPYRICGFPPLYTFLSTFPECRGKTLCYNRWDETERESAVTFGSILYQ